MSLVPKAILWVRGGPEDSRTIELLEVVTTIGRAPMNAIIVDEVGVSRQHAGIRKDQTGYWIEDLGSRNGTWINGARIEGEGQKLRDSDRIELGGVSSVHWIFRELEATVGITLPTQGDRTG